MPDFWLVTTFETVVLDEKRSIASANVHSKWHFLDTGFLQKVKDGSRQLVNGVGTMPSAGTTPAPAALERVIRQWHAPPPPPPQPPSPPPATLNATAGRSAELERLFSAFLKTVNVSTVG